MDIRLHSTVFEPQDPGGRFCVMASTFVASPSIPVRIVHRETAEAADLESARQKSCQLTRRLIAAATREGHVIVSMRCTHCPSPDAPVCKDFLADHNRASREAAIRIPPLAPA